MSVLTSNLVEIFIVSGKHMTLSRLVGQLDSK